MYGHRSARLSLKKHIEEKQTPRLILLSLEHNAANKQNEMTLLRSSICMSVIQIDGPIKLTISKKNNRKKLVEKQSQLRFP